MANATQVALDNLTAKVTALTDADESAITLLKGLATIIRENAGNPAAIKAIADKVEAETVKLTDAINANTDAGTEPTT